MFLSIDVHLGIVIFGGYGYSKQDYVEYYFTESPTDSHIESLNFIIKRSDFIAMPMDDGKILIAGGHNNIGPLSSTELFDPGTRKLEVGPEMSSPRDRPFGAVLGGSIYVCGGWNMGSVATLGQLDSCEQLHLGKWTQVGSMSEARWGMGMASTDGQLFTIGGYKTALVEKYEPGNGVWAKVSSLPTKRYWFSAAGLDGLVYVCGGHDGKNAVDLCERYDPKKDHWKTVASMKDKRWGHNLLAVKGHLYAIGGTSKSLEGGRSVERYDPTKDQWTLMSRQLIKPHALATAVAM